MGKKLIYHMCNTRVALCDGFTVCRFLECVFLKWGAVSSEMAAKSHHSMGLQLVPKLLCELETSDYDKQHK